ncbi:hypothetical protein GCM10012279_05180 [Micromonospora yangpuensis]|uniref:Uncharacterized protein n=1 Tax=Micromonospora yangpuensis TaxID=683228 RepID=A0A1C6U6W3_9ACTN|nr:hypothetical protein GCM10012279_05180 [Micromonospora yangpuensis]SCL49825.1 hypothetical protein GA0070617_1297 [Micromonospora yangpuensis]
MSQQRHDIGWQKANREGAPTRGRAAAERRRQAKRASAAAVLARADAAALVALRDEEFHVRERARAAGVPGGRGGARAAAGPARAGRRVRPLRRAVEPRQQAVLLGGVPEGAPGRA